MKLNKKQIVSGTSFNFGPSKSSNKSVKRVIDLMNKNFSNSVKLTQKKSFTKFFKESSILMLNSNKSRKILKWKSKYSLEKSINLTATWYKEFINKKNKNILEEMEDQIKDYIN